MKKRLTTISIITCFIANGLIYPVSGVVTDVNETAIIETMDGHLYEIDAEDNGTRDIISCIMFNNGTPEDVTDDIILTYRYSGTIEQFEKAAR
jgi:hypothetical protein